MQEASFLRDENPLLGEVEDAGLPEWVSKWITHPWSLKAPSPPAEGNHPSPFGERLPRSKKKDPKSFFIRTI